MKPIQDFEVKKSAIHALPAGGYVAKIYSAKEENYSWGDVLWIHFDICEGEYTGYFKQKYDNRKNEDEKWKGKIRLTLPTEKAKYPESAKSTLQNAIWSIEQSNPGYTWDWNEATLKGKTVGVLFRNREWEWNGDTGWTTEACSLIDADSIRNKNFRVPKDKPLNGGAAQERPAQAQAYTEITADDDLPF